MRAERISALNIHLLLFTAAVPLWFLVLSLFLPRICLIVAWLQHNNSLPVHIDGWIPIILAAIVPRIVILLLIYSDQGVSLWFLIHLVALLLAWGGGGTRVVRRRRGDYEVVD